MKNLRIRNWREHFENNRTRELKKMDWVPIPNRMDKREYVRLVSHPKGAAHLGAWLAIVEIASRCDPRGTLPWEGAEIPQALAEISRLPARLFEEVLPRLVELKWIEQVTGEPQDDAEIPQEGAGKSQDDAPRAHARYGREGNGREGNGTEEDSADAGASSELALVSPISESDLIAATAARLCKRHPKPRTCGPSEARKRLHAIVSKLPKAERAAELQRIDCNHQGWCECEQWVKDGGEYAKGLANWLAPTEGRYDLEPPPRARDAPPGTGSKSTDAVLELAKRNFERTGRIFG